MPMRKPFSAQHAKAARVRAFEKWEEKVEAATIDLLSALREIPKAPAGDAPPELLLNGLQEQDRLVPEIVQWLCGRVGLACYAAKSEPFTFTVSDLVALRAMRDQTRSPVYGNPSAGVALAAENLDQTLYGIAHRRDDDPPLELAVSTFQQLLEFEVHPGFSELRDKLAEVQALLLRFEHDPRRRRTPRGTEGKLSADGILVALNELSGRPLGVGKLTTSAIANARKRYPKLRDPRHL